MRNHAIFSGFTIYCKVVVSKMLFREGKRALAILQPVLESTISFSVNNLCPPVVVHVNGLGLSIRSQECADLYSLMTG